MLLNPWAHREAVMGPDPFGGNDFTTPSTQTPLSSAVYSSTVPAPGLLAPVDGPDRAGPRLSWETGKGKSYLIPALEIPSFIVLLNVFDRLTHGNDVENGKKVYSTNLSTFWDHVTHGPWGFDQDSFKMNQFMHPYQGSIYYGFARSAGLGRLHRRL